MAQITLEYNARNTYAKKTIEYILSLGFFKRVDNTAIDKSLQEVKKGKTKKYKSVDEFFEKMS
ncbi:MAG: hypothetical protein KBG80_03620 [Breznakibacter sp.]|nr:hypothetical protein [Breznakibacter sp.]